MARLAHSTYWTWSARSSPSFRRSSSRSFAYDVSASMSCTASPGIRRGSVKTITEAISSEGIAITSRRARYRLSTRSAIQPGRHEPSAVVVAEVRGVVLQRAVRHRGVHPADRGRVVDLLREVALDLVDQLTPLGDVVRPTLADDHVGHDGIVDVALVLHLIGKVIAKEIVVAVEERRLRPERQRVELAVEARGDVRAVLLGIELGVDPDVLEVLHDELRVIDDNR